MRWKVQRASTLLGSAAPGVVLYRQHPLGIDCVSRDAFHLKRISRLDNRGSHVAAADIFHTASSTSLPHFLVDLLHICRSQASTSLTYIVLLFIVVSLIIISARLNSLVASQCNANDEEGDGHLRPYATHDVGTDIERPLGGQRALEFDYRTAFHLYSHLDNPL